MYCILNIYTQYIGLCINLIYLSLHSLNLHPKRWEFVIIEHAFHILLMRSKQFLPLPSQINWTCNYNFEKLIVGSFTSTLSIAAHLMLTFKSLYMKNQQEVLLEKQNALHLGEVTRPQNIMMPVHQLCFSACVWWLLRTGVTLIQRTFKNTSSLSKSAQLPELWSIRMQTLTFLCMQESLCEFQISTTY